MPRNITILGKSPTGKLCPFEDEIWGINNVCEQYPDKKFEMVFAFDLLDKEYTDAVKKFAPIISWQDYADIKYPLDEIIAEYKTRFFTNTVGYCIAYAAYLKVDKISIYGVDTVFGAPYAQENRGVEYWLGRAAERGIEIFAPRQSQLLQPIYGCMYGEQGSCNISLYLHERINLINMLPRAGRYTESLKAQNVWWVLFPKEDEAKAHNVEVQRLPDGALNFGFKPPTPEHPQSGEYLSDVQMPPESWEYLKGLLISLEAEGKLSFAVISAYEKLILCKEQTK